MDDEFSFTLTIGLGNSAMETAEDVAAALEEVARDIRLQGTAGDSGIVRDYNGNTVGKWEFQMNDFEESR